MIPSFDLSVLAPPTPPVPQPAPVLRAEGPGRAFPELLAGLGATTGGAAEPAIEVEGAEEAGNALPDAAGESGNGLPGALPLALLAVLPPVQPAPQIGAATAPPHEETPPAHTPDLPKAPALPTGAAPAAGDPDLSQPAFDGSSERATQPASDARPAALPAEVAAPTARAVELAVTTPAPLTVAREAAPAAPPPAPIPAAVTPGSELEALVEVLAQAREAGRGARGELALRHAEFGTVAIRLEQAEGETRATIIGRDPGIAPAVVAALAERAATGSFDQHHTPQHQRGGEPALASGQGDPRQPDRRAAPERATSANPPPRERDQPGEHEPRSGRFA